MNLVCFISRFRLKCYLLCGRFSVRGLLRDGCVFRAVFSAAEPRSPERRFLLLLDWVSLAFIFAVKNLITNEGGGFITNEGGGLIRIKVVVSFE